MLLCNLKLYVSTLPAWNHWFPWSKEIALGNTRPMELHTKATLHHTITVQMQLIDTSLTCREDFCLPACPVVPLFIVGKSSPEWGKYHKLICYYICSSGRLLYFTIEALQGFECRYGRMELHTTKKTFWREIKVDAGSCLLYSTQSRLTADLPMLCSLPMDSEFDFHGIVILATVPEEGKSLFLRGICMTSVPWKPFGSVLEAFPFGNSSMSFWRWPIVEMEVEMDPVCVSASGIFLSKAWQEAEHDSEFCIKKLETSIKDSSLSFTIPSQFCLANQNLATRPKGTSICSLNWSHCEEGKLFSHWREWPDKPVGVLSWQICDGGVSLDASSALSSGLPSFWFFEERERWGTPDHLEKFETLW